MKAGHRFRFDDDVFQNLVQRMTDMNAAVGIGRAIVQHIERPALSAVLKSLVQALLFPPGEKFGLPLRQIRLHREISAGQIQGRFVIHAV